MNGNPNRRQVLQGSLLGAVAYLAGCTSSGISGTSRPLVGFTSVPRTASDGTKIVLAPEYSYQILLPWGEPLLAGGPEWRWPPTAEAQAQQVGVGHDGIAYFPLSEDGRRGLLALNHEYGSNPHVLGAAAPANPAQVLASQHAHGVSVVEIQETDGRWAAVPNSSFSRRIHLNTEAIMAGPVAGHALISNRAGNPPAGTLNNCAGGETPWGTYLTCEENFNFYFGSDDAFEPGERQRRYDLRADGSYYGWHRFDPRFDLANADYANEANRFGWVVEIDPADRSAAPVKRTALGRFKHEGATVVEAADGRLVVYMGDDQRFEFIYRFVSRDRWRDMRAAGVSPLDEGTLYVARFDDGGRGEWLPLSHEQPALAAAFADQADVLVHARLAATLLGATPMDRPEWISVGPGGEVYCTLTNNTRRKQPDAANPVAPNTTGQILRWWDDGQHTNARFSWDHFLICEDLYETEQSLGSPDGLWADPDGRLLICTDGPQFEDQPNQLMVADIVTGELRRLLVGITGCEITGLATTPDRKTLFVNVQHPGNGDPRVTSFPAPDDGATVPRDCTLVVRRNDGGVIGS